jgi:hypothetical protein
MKIMITMGMAIRLQSLFFQSNNGWDFVMLGGDCDDSDPDVANCTEIPFTKLENQFNAQFLPSFSTIIYADEVPEAEKYRFEVSDNTTTEVIDRPSRNFKITDYSNFKYSHTYLVRVASRINGEWTPYGITSVIYTPMSPRSQIKANQCGLTVSAMSTTLYADAVPSASAYKFRVTSGSNTQEIVKNVPSFRFNELTNPVYGTSYTIEVSALLYGDWSFYGIPCTVSTPVATTAIENIYCGTTVAFNKIIYATGVSYATTYRFKITEGVNVNILEKNNRYFTVNEIPGYAYGTNYNIQAAVFVNGQWSSYGTSCTITTISAPTSQLANGYCGATMPNVKSVVYANHISQAARYRFRIVDGSTTHFIENTARYFGLYNIPGNTYSKTYIVDVAVQIGGVWGPYGPACTVSTPSSSTSRPGSEIVSEEFQADTVTQAIALTSYPNPFTESFTIEMNTSSQEKVSVRAFDINGRLVENITTSPEELSSKKLGGNLAAGIYSLIVSQGEYLKTFKVVKK